MTEQNRRTFLTSAAGVVAAGSLAARASGQSGPTTRSAPRSSASTAGARRTSEGFMGTKGVKVAVLCDPDRDVLDKRGRRVREASTAYKVETETDLRKVFDRKDVDVVSVATPNHWHSLATIWACQAGKDVYVEKPGSHNIFEGRKMVEAAKKYGRIVQHGVQLRSSEAVREAVDHLRKGLIGKVYMARGLVFRDRPSIGHFKDPDTPPSTLDWNIWQGPAQERAFSQAARPLQLALALGLRQRRRRQPGRPRDRHVPLGPGPGDASQRDRRHGRQVPLGRRQGDPRGSLEHATTSPRRTR